RGATTVGIPIAQGEEAVTGFGKAAGAAEQTAESGCVAIGIDERTVGQRHRDRRGEDAGDLQCAAGEIEGGAAVALCDAIGSADVEGAAGVQVEGAAAGVAGAEEELAADRHRSSGADAEHAAAEIT